MKLKLSPFHRVMTDFGNYGSSMTFSMAASWVIGVGVDPVWWNRTDLSLFRFRLDLFCLGFIRHG